MVVKTGIAFLSIKLNLGEYNKGTNNWQMLCRHKKENSCDINEDGYPSLRNKYYTPQSLSARLL